MAGRGGLDGGVEPFVPLRMTMGDGDFIVGPVSFGDVAARTVGGEALLEDDWNRLSEGARDAMWIGVMRRTGCGDGERDRGGGGGSEALIVGALRISILVRLLLASGLEGRLRLGVPVRASLAAEGPAAIGLMSEAMLFCRLWE